MHQWKHCLWRKCILYQHCGFLLLYLQGRIHWRWTLVFRYIIILIIKYVIKFKDVWNACTQNLCKNNATCQARFTDRDYHCFHVSGSGFKGHDCDEGKESCIFSKAEKWCISDKLRRPLSQIEVLLGDWADLFEMDEYQTTANTSIVW